MNYNTVIPVIRKLALQAGDEIIKFHQSGNFSVETKSDASPVTEADKAADAIISDGLRTVFPDTLLISEEQPETHSKHADTFFIVDPLDGTRGFVERRGDFTVNIALVENGIPTRGVIYAPARQRLFYTLGNGQSVEETVSFDKGRSSRLTTLTVSEPDNSALRIVATKSHRNQVTEDYIGRYRGGEDKHVGSSLKFCLVASGEADLYPRLNPTMEWDTAAGHAILAAAGGQVLRLEDHAPLQYGKAGSGYLNPFFIACSHGVDLVEPKVGGDIEPG